MLKRGGPITLNIDDAFLKSPVEKVNELTSCYLRSLRAEERRLASISPNEDFEMIMDVSRAFAL